MKNEIYEFQRIPFRRHNLPYCGKCGFQVNEEMQFCPNCGAPLKAQPYTQKKAVSSTKSNTMPVLIRSTPFTNGILIGLGTAMLLGSLMGASILNANYWELRDYFVASGLEPQQIRFMLSMNVALIAFCAVFAVVGIYSL